MRNSFHLITRLKVKIWFNSCHKGWQISRMNIKELRERHGREGSWEKSPEWGYVVLDGAGRRRDLKIAFPSFSLHFPEPQSKSHRTRAPKRNRKQSSYLKDRCLVIYAYLQKTFTFSFHLLFLLLHCFNRIYNIK